MSTLKRFLARFIIFTFMVTSIFTYYSPVFAAGTASTPERSKVEILVKYKMTGEAKTAAKTSKQNDVRTNVKNKLKLSKLDVKTKFKNPNMEVLTVGATDDITKVIAELKKNPDVEYAQPNYKLTVFDTTTEETGLSGTTSSALSAAIPDERFGDQWGLLNNGQNIGWIAGVSGIDINITEGWKQTKGNSSVVVGILDTGIDIYHNDLENNIYRNPGDIPGNNLDDDGNGYIDDTNGWDFANDDNTVFDSASADKHGTHVAGIIAAGEGNGGIKGVAPGIKILPLKFINGNSGYTSDIIQAIEYAKQMGVKVINCSFGGSDMNNALKEAMSQSGILFVCAAGNSSRDNRINPVYPASFDLSNIISVAAMDNRGKLAGFSNFGANVDIAAPGVDILSTVPGNNYETQSGTSMAAPFVTGVSALLQSKYPDMTPAQMIGRITSNVAISSELMNRVDKGSYLDAGAALAGTITSDTDNGESGTSTGDEENNAATVDTLTAEISQKLLEEIHFGETGVNAGTGNYSKSITDISVAAPGFQVNISRTYNSKDDRATSTMGRGWTFGFEGNLAKDTTNASLYIAKLPNGSSQSFSIDANGKFTANDSRSKLEKQSDNTYILTTKDQYTYCFNTVSNPSPATLIGYLVWMKDKNGNKIDISVDNTNGRVQKITDTVGREYAVAYTNGYITSVTDPIGRVVIYTYDASNRLQQAFMKDASGITQGAISLYEYDSSNYLNVIKVKKDSSDTKPRIAESIVYDHTAGTNQHKVTSYTDELKNQYTYAYTTGTDSQTNRATYTATITDSTGRVFIKKFDDSFYIKESTDPEKCTTSVTYLLDSLNRNIYGEETSVTDRAKNKTVYERNDQGNVKKITYPDNSIEEFNYDTKNNLIMEKDRNGKCTYYVYDAQGINLIKKAQPINGVDNYVPESDQSKYVVTTYTYYTEAEAKAMGCNAKGLLKTQTDSEGNSTRYTYDQYGSHKTATDAESNTVTYNYNKIGWLLNTISAADYRTDYVYDYAGRVIKIVQDGGETTRMAYDTEGRKKLELKPNEYDASKEEANNAYTTTTSGISYDYDATTGKLLKKWEQVWDGETKHTYETSYTYDLRGNQITEIKPNKSKYMYDYDSMNRLKKVWYMEDERQTTSQAIVLEEYNYEILPDNNTKKTYIKYLNDSETAVTTFTFDYADRLIEQVNPDGGRITTAYNANGTVRSTTDANGGTTYFRYDGINRLTGKWVQQDHGSYSYTGYVYDKAGKVTEERTGKDLVELDAIPSADRTFSKFYEYYHNGRQKSIKDSNGGRTEYKYDADGNLTLTEKYTSKATSSFIEYTNNHLGKPVSKRVFVKAGDIAGNNVDDSEVEVLTTTYEYDKNGNLISQTTPDGTETTYQYDSRDRQFKMSQPGIDENGMSRIVSTTTIYDENNKVVKTVDPKSNETGYTYTKRGLLASTKKEATNVSNQKEDYTSVFEYDRAGRKITEVSPANYTTGQAITEMSRTEYTYDRMDRVKTQKEVYKSTTGSAIWTSFVSKAYKYDFNGNVVKELDGEGYAAGAGATADEKINSGYGKEYTFNLGNKLSMVLDSVSKERGLQFSTKYTYDGAGRKAAEENGNGSVTSYVYDDAGNIISVAVKNSSSAPAQIIKSMEYDAAGNLIKQIDGNGNATSFEYNAIGKVRKAEYPGDESIPSNIITNQYDVMGNLSRKQDSQGTTELFAYDRQGHELTHSVQSEDGKQSITTSKSYDLNGNVAGLIDGNSNFTSMMYDELNRLIKTKVTVSTIDGRAVDHTSTIVYDKNGSKLRETDWRGNAVSYEYDALGRLQMKKDPYATVQKLAYNRSSVQIESKDAYDNVTKFDYDKNNRLVATTDPEGHVTRQDYDNAGNVSLKTDGRGSDTKYVYDHFNRLTSVVNAKGEKTNYIYDLNGNMITQTDGNGNTTTFEYNAANKQIRKIDNSGRKGNEGKYTYDPARTESYTYFADGSLKTKLDRNGVTTEYTYDAFSRLLSQKAGEESISYAYDNNGNQLEMTDSTGTTKRSYDELNRVILKVVPNIGTTTFNYDVTSLAGVEEGQTGEISKDPKGNSTIKVYDKVGRIKKVKDGNDTVFTVYDYDFNGNRTKVTYPNGSVESYSYYKDNLLKELVNKKSDADTLKLEYFKYVYDGAHNQISKEDNKGTTSYVYDDLSRLLKVDESYSGGNSSNNRVTEYTYDKAGNRLTEKETKAGSSNPKLTTYAYNDQNRLMSTSIKSVNMVDTTKYSYDNNGNMTSKTNESIKSVAPLNPPTPHFGLFIPGQGEDKSATEYAKNIVKFVGYYEYNVWNQMIKASSGVNVMECKYNAEGYRVEKIADGKTTRYLYEYDKVVLEVDGKGVQIAKNTYGVNLLSRKDGSDTLYYMYNGHADVTMLIDNTGTIQASYYYDAFGTSIDWATLENGKKNPYRYAGYQYDSEVGLYYLNARYYDSKIARFLSEDTYRGEAKDPMSLNLYTYCHNEPIMYIDPSGHRNLYNGCSGDDVKVLQKELNEAGYSIVVDGKFGPKTEAALEDYQKKNKLVVDGIAGSKTMASLTSDNKKPSTPTSSTATSSNTPQQNNSGATNSDKNIIDSVADGIKSIVGSVGNFVGGLFGGGKDTNTPANTNSPTNPDAPVKTPTPTPVPSTSNQGTGNDNVASGSKTDPNEGFDYEWTGKYVTAEFKAKVLKICKELKMDPDDLMAIMAFESGFNPANRNSRSGATGLIQWMPSTARGYGTTTDALAKMSAIDQLDYVLEYFKPYAGKIHNIQDAYMVVFMPIAVGKDNDYVLGEKDSSEIFYGKTTYGKIYEDNSVLDHDGDGTIHKWEAAQEVLDTRSRYKKIK